MHPLRPTANLAREHRVYRHPISWFHTSHTRSYGLNPSEDLMARDSREGAKGFEGGARRKIQISEIGTADSAPQDIQSDPSRTRDDWIGELPQAKAAQGAMNGTFAHPPEGAGEEKTGDGNIEVYGSHGHSQVADKGERAALRAPRG